MNSIADSDKSKNVQGQSEVDKTNKKLAANANLNQPVKIKKTLPSNSTSEITKVDPRTIASNDRPVLKTNINSGLNDEISAPETPVTRTEAINKPDIVDQPSNARVKSDYATEALLSDNIDVEPELVVEENGGRKGAFRGIIRKANRFINKVTNPDTNGPSVKVASFEIALAK